MTLPDPVSPALSPSQRLILQALFAPPPMAQRAWQDCLAGCRSPDDLPRGALPLLPLLLHRFGRPAGPLGRHLLGVVRHQTARRLMVQSELRRLVVAMSAAGVEVMLIKGLAQALARPELPARAIDDLDLLVRPEAMADAARVLEQAGMRPPSPSLAGRNSAHLHPWDPTRHSVEFDAQQGFLQVDLHRRPNHLFPLDLARIDRLWSDATLMPAGDGQVRIPCLEDRIAITCGHAAYVPNRASGAWLRYLVDLRQLLAEPDLDRARLEWALRLDTNLGQSRSLLAWSCAGDPDGLPAPDPLPPLAAIHSQRWLFRRLQASNLLRAMRAMGPAVPLSLILPRLTIRWRGISDAARPAGI